MMNGKMPQSAAEGGCSFVVLGNQQMHHDLLIAPLQHALDEADAAAARCGIREGETLAELITRLYSETLADPD